MTERWERELRKLDDLEPSAAVVRQRVWVGPREAGSRPRRERALAGVVASVVAIAAIALVVRTLPAGPARVGAGDLPALTVSFHDSKVIPQGPDASYRRVETSIAYGHAVDESFTSTTSENAIVDWVAVEDLTRFVPGPTIGSLVRFEADGDDPRVLLGRPDDWPNFGRMERIARLPDEPGEYLLVFAADYPEGTARTARRVTVVEPGLVQLVARPGDDPGTGTATAYLDGTGVDGSLTVGFGSAPAGYPSGSWLDVPPGARVILTGAAGADAPWFVAAAEASLSEDPANLDGGSARQLDVLSGDVIDAVAGRYALAVEILWMQEHPNETTTQRTLALFPIEITAPAVETPAPTVEPTPSPSPIPEGSVKIDIRRTPEPVSQDPRATATFGEQRVQMCPDGWSLVNEDGTTENLIFDCGQGDVFEAPQGTPIVVTGDFATSEVSTHVRGEAITQTDVVPAVEAGAVVTYAYEVTWEDGSKASFWLQVTVRGDDGQPAPDGAIVVRIFGLGERSSDMPTATSAFGGQTTTACTESWRWSTGEGRSQGGEAFCSGRGALHVPPGTPIVIQAATASRVIATRATTPFYQGDAGLAVTAEWSTGRADFRFTVIVSHAARGSRGVVLDCPEEDRIEFATPDGPRILPGGPAYIRGNMDGFLQTDVIEQMTRYAGGESEWDGVWQVVRDGSVIAAVDFSSLGGVACRGTGVGGV